MEIQAHILCHALSMMSEGQCFRKNYVQGVIPITTVTSLRHLPAQQMAAKVLADTVGGSGMLSQSGGDLTAAALLVETFLWEPCMEHLYETTDKPSKRV